MEEKRSYLEQLKFDPKLNKGIIASYLTNFRFVLLLILTIAVMGLFSYFNLPRRLNPEVKIPIVLVSTVLPGAGPQDVESLVTIPLEDTLSGLEGVNTTTSSSQDNVSAISIEFNSGYDPEKAKDNVQSAIDSVTKLPTDAQTPKVVKIDFENQPIWQFLITTDSDTSSLISFANNLKDKIEKVPTVKEVNITGTEEQEIQVLVKPEAQNEFKIDPLALSRAVQAAVPSYPAGSINTQNSSFTLTIDPTIKSTQDLRHLKVNLQGTTHTLGDIAQIQEKSKPTQAKTFYATNTTLPQRAIAVSVFKTSTANIDKAATDAKIVTDQTLKSYNNRFQIITIQDVSNEVNKQFKGLIGSFRDTIFLVILTLLVFLGLRQALIVAFSIPLSFLVAFIVMNIMGLTLNFLSLFSLILALGLLVDDAIVTVTAVTAYWRTRKFTPNQTGLLVYRDFIIPIFSTTFTAVWAFLPLLITTGILGEFIKTIPIVVSTTLLASTSIAILITLPTMMIFLKPNFPNRVKKLLLGLLFLSLLAALTVPFIKTPILPAIIVAAIIFFIITFKTRKSLLSQLRYLVNKKIDLIKWHKLISKVADHGLIDSQKFAHKYQRLIEKILSSKSLRIKTIIMIVVFALSSYTLVPLGFVVNEFFPKTDQNNIYVSVELPAGTNLQKTQEKSQELLDELRKTQPTDFTIAEAGKSLDTNSFFGLGTATNKISYTLVLPDHEERNKTSFAIAQELRNKYKNYTDGKFQVLEQSSGPPAGADIQIKLSGEDLTVLDEYADSVVLYLTEQSGANNVAKSINPGTSKIAFTPDYAKMAQYRITEDNIGFQLRTFASGFTLDTNIKLNGDSRDIVFRTAERAQNPENLTGLIIQTPHGNIPIVELGTFKLKPNPTLITRENQKRTISVTAGVNKGYSVSTINKGLENFAKNNLALPQGYDWKTGGVNEENQKSVNSILQAMVISFILIAATMILQFASYRKAIINLFLIPLGISGVFVVFALTGTPLSFPALIGVMALFGIVVYHSMLIVEKTNKNIRAGMYLKHAIADAAASRVEPILFGTITTVVGLIPITISDPLWRGLGGAIIAGMLFSGVIMLLFIPVVYYMIFEKEVR